MSAAYSDDGLVRRVAFITSSPSRKPLALCLGSLTTVYGVVIPFTLYAMASSAVHSFTALLLVSLALSVFASHPSNQQHAGLHHKRLLFDPLTDAVDVTGRHAWNAPTEGQQRGPCPGLNALANHGYISRHGVVTLPEVLEATNSVYGMGLDVATLLASIGLVSGGAPVSLLPKFSIGGEDKAVSLLLNGLLGVAGMPQGLNMTHNLVEADSSPTRDDLYETGDAWTMNLEKFKEMLSLFPTGEDDVTPLVTMSDFAAKRFHQSVATNPYFYYGPFTGLVGRNAGYAFVARFFSNHSSANPSGQLNSDILKSFFGVSGEGADMVYNYGHERIPDNWYRRPVDYSLVELNVDVLSFAMRHPILASIGGNTGSVESFTGVDLTNLTGGVLNAATLLESNNLVCFALQTVKLAAPSFTNNLFATLSKPLDIILDSLSVPLVSLRCPPFDALESGGNDILDALSQYGLPGADEGLL